MLGETLRAESGRESHMIFLNFSLPSSEKAARPLSISFESRGAITVISENWLPTMLEDGHLQ
jgi:hypothetical protein